MVIIIVIIFCYINFFFIYIFTEKIEREKIFVKGVLSRIRESYDLSIPISTGETSPISEDETTQCVLKPEIESEEATKGDEILQLDLSESEAEELD